MVEKCDVFCELICCTTAIAPPSACEPNPCQNDGVCTDLGGMGAYECTCSAGFKGDDCETGRPMYFIQDILDYTE